MNQPPPTDQLLIAVVDDEPKALKHMGRVLSRTGHRVECFPDPTELLQRMPSDNFQIVLTDIRMPVMDGIQLLEQIKIRHPETEVILVTGFAAIDDAVDAIKKGAFDYIEKPLTPKKILSVFRRVVDKLALVSENRQLKKELLKKDETGEILGISPAIRELVKLIHKVSRIDCNVLITGESGTGKELVARAIHHGSLRKNRPFVGINGGGFTEELIANELFGHEKGAYTGADAAKQGLFESAQGGTVFLDEISEMTLSMQVKLLRVLQERTLIRVGGAKPVLLDIRVISATNKDLEHEVRSGRFREDLYFRLKVVVIRTPPLRERPEDIVPLAEHFLRYYARLYHRELIGFDDTALDVLKRYSFPGNVRELEHIVCSAVALSEKNRIGTDDLPDDLKSLEVSPISCHDLISLAEQEKAHIVRVLESTNYSKVRAAGILGIPRTSLWRKIKKFGIDDRIE